MRLVVPLATATAASKCAVEPTVDVVPHEHLDSPRALLPPGQNSSRHHRIASELLAHIYVQEGVLGLPLAGRMGFFDIIAVKDEGTPLELQTGMAICCYGETAGEPGPVLEELTEERRDERRVHESPRWRDAELRPHSVRLRVV